MPESCGSALSVFSGLGGMDLGARIAGLDAGLATDVDEEALSLLGAATGVSTIATEIEEGLAGPIAGLWGDRGSPRILIGGPPCTPFSHAGFWLEGKRSGHDPASSLLSSYVRCLEAFCPDAFVLENVPGLVFKTHERFLRGFIERVRSLKYNVAHAVLSASQFGVAQARRRLFIVGIRAGAPPRLDEFPQWPVRGARWAIGALADALDPELDEQPGEKYRDLLLLVPPGENYLHFTDRRGWNPPIFRYRGRYWSFLLKMHPDRPAPTVPAQRITYNGPFHWENRHLRLREIARLQSFPDWYPLSDELSTARRHLGNAVPPLLAAAVIWRMRQALGDAPEGGWPDPLEALADPDVTFEEVTSAYPRTGSRHPSRSMALERARQS